MGMSTPPPPPPPVSLEGVGPLPPAGFFLSGGAAIALIDMARQATMTIARQLIWRRIGGVVPRERNDREQILRFLDGSQHRVEDLETMGKAAVSESKPKGAKGGLFAEPTLPWEQVWHGRLALLALSVALLTLSYAPFGQFYLA